MSPFEKSSCEIVKSLFKIVQSPFQIVRFEIVKSS